MGSDRANGDPTRRQRRLLGAAAGVIAVAGIGVAVLATRGGGDGDGPDTAAATGGTAGTITGADAEAATLTVEVRDTDDPVEVQAGDDTTISETVEGSAADLAVGDDVVVIGESADGAVAADQIVAGGAGGGFPAGSGALTSGTIASIDDGSLTVRSSDDDESVAVTLSSATIVLVAEELSFDDLGVGDEVTVTGEIEDGVLDAVTIRRGDGGGNDEGGPT